MALDFVVKFSFFLFLIVIWSTVSYMIFIEYRKNKINAYLFYNINILFLTIPTLSFLLFDNINEPNYYVYRLYGNIVANFLSITSPLIFMFIYIHYSGREQSIRHYLYIFIVGYGFGLYMITQRWVYSIESSTWLIYFDNPAGIYALGFGLLLIIVENITITSYNLKISKNKATRQEIYAFNLVFISEIITLISLLIFIIERDILNLHSSLYYMQFGIISILIKVFSLNVNPLAFVPLNINAKHLLVIDKKLGMSLFEYDFEVLQKNLYIMSIALTALQMVLKDISNYKDLPEKIKHVNLVLTIEENDDRIIYLMSERSFDIINTCMRKIISIDNIPDIELYIHDDLQFLR